MSGRRLATAVAWVLGLGVVAAGLHWTGEGALAAPPVTDPAGWAAWLGERTPVVAAFGLVRLLAVAALWYVVVAALSGAVLRLVGAASLVQVADRFTIGPVRRLLAGSLTFGVASSGLLVVAAPALRAPAAAQSATTSTTTTTAPSATAPVTMHRLDPAEVPPTPSVAPASRIEAGRWTVRPGECFWSKAEAVLGERLGRAPTDAEIVPYWRRLIDANRGELVSRADPDLILPGQVFTMPSP
jgi:nucleoid-associated protein YgaU